MKKFLSLILALVLVLTSLVAVAEEDWVKTPGEIAAWDREVDFLIVGYGLAGAAAAVEAHDIDPEAEVLVLEKNAAAWQEWNISACDGWVSEETGQSILESALEIREVDMGTLSVTNISREKLPEVWLFYKNYLEEGDLYIGGITYIETVGSLDSGETVRINPNHYAAGYSRIIKAEEIG